MLLATNITVAVMLVAAGSVYGYVTWRFGQIKRIHITHLGNATGKSEAPGSPMTILIVGSDSRAGITGADAKAFGSGAAVGGQRSDTIILLHVDPKTTSATLMSIPRDLWVQIPGKDFQQRINTTFDTGPDLLVQAIEQDVGIQIDHYIEVNFNSFRQVVAAVGGVKQYFPTPARDVFSNLVVQNAGCVNLTGDGALAFVRSRHYEYYANGRWHFEAESDLARIRRQQSFIRKMMAKAQSSGLTDPLRLNSIVGGITSNLTVDSGFSQGLMLSLAKRFRSISPDNLPSVTLPTDPAVIQGNDVLQIKQPDAQDAINAFLGKAPVNAPASTTTAPSVPTGISAADVRVSVLNGTGVRGQAGAVETSLRAQGFVVVSIGSAPTYNNPTSVIRYGNGGAGKAALLATAIVGGATLQADSTLQGADVVLTTGATFAGIRTPGAAATTVPSPSTTAGATPTTAAPATPSATAYQLPGTPAGFVAPPC